MEPTIERVVTVEKVLYKATLWVGNNFFEVTAQNREALESLRYASVADSGSYNGHYIDLGEVERVVVSSSVEKAAAHEYPEYIPADHIVGEVQAAYGYDFENQSKINAIKRYRDLTGNGLKESKDAVEAMIANGEIY